MLSYNKALMSPQRTGQLRTGQQCSRLTQTATSQPAGRCCVVPPCPAPHLYQHALLADHEVDHALQGVLWQLLWAAVLQAGREAGVRDAILWCCLCISNCCASADASKHHSITWASRGHGPAAAGQGVCMINHAQLAVPPRGTTYVLLAPQHDPPPMHPISNAISRAISSTISSSSPPAA